MSGSVKELEFDLRAKGKLRGLRESLLNTGLISRSKRTLKVKITNFDQIWLILVHYH